MPAHSARQSGENDNARADFKLSENKTSVQDRDRGRDHDLPDHGLHHLRQSGDPRGCQDAVWRVFVATCVAAAIGCFLMAFLANYPIAWRRAWG
jgi:Permeases